MILILILELDRIFSHKKVQITLMNNKFYHNHIKFKKKFNVEKKK
jgi:hypothetical protein